MKCAYCPVSSRLAEHWGLPWFGRGYYCGGAGPWRWRYAVIPFAAFVPFRLR